MIGRKLILIKIKIEFANDIRHFPIS